jgi:hypothetical protein
MKGTIPAAFNASTDSLTGVVSIPSELINVPSRSKATSLMVSLRQPLYILRSFVVFGFKSAISLAL